MTTNMLFGLFGGMAMLLYGMRLVGEGLQLAAGGKLRQVLGSLTRNRVTGLLAGAAITAIIQSSGATTVMLVGFASSGLVTLPQTLGVILGADIGTTLTVQLIAFQIAAYALVLVGVGFALTFWAKRQVFRYAGQAILGFGLIFLAIQLMGEVTAPLRESPVISALLVSLGDYPLLGLLVAALFTALVCSSAGGSRGGLSASSSVWKSEPEFVVTDNGTLDGKITNPSSLSYIPSVKRADLPSLWLRPSLPRLECRAGECSQLDCPPWGWDAIPDKGEPEETVGVEGGGGWT